MKKILNTPLKSHPAGSLSPSTTALIFHFESPQKKSSQRFPDYSELQPAEQSFLFSVKWRTSEKKVITMSLKKLTCLMRG